ncbi:MAG: YfhO family protein, partial [Chloroflexi bacterium]|nr:YfhO family protein [Chloroflexota bacterium]
MTQARPAPVRTWIVPALILVGFTLIVFHQLAFTDWIMARGDTYIYHYPYWGARNTALLDGRLPLWSPELFMGVPLLANSQIGTFYPPNWLVAPLDPPNAVRISALMHVAWAALGTYALARRALTVGVIPALLAATLFAFGGYLSAHVEQINQLHGLAWLPWLFLLFDAALARPRRWLLILGGVFALQFFSGHTQTVFITAVGLGIYALLTRPIRGVLTLISAGGIALLLALPQIVPTLELTSVSNRSGGLTPAQATAFSLSPLVVGRGLLPSYNGVVFSEYIAYLGVIGVGLAVVGALSPQIRSANTTRRLSPRVVWLIITLIGLALAFGLYNPLYWTLASLPGFNLFRVPARWLALFALGGALLAALGLHTLMIRRLSWRMLGLHLLVIAALIGGLAASNRLLPLLTEPIPMTPAAAITGGGWLVAALALIGGLLLIRRFGARAAPLLLAAAGLELLLASGVQQFNHLVPPDMYHARRFTISQLRAYTADAITPGRVLSISDLLFDPGDRAALEARFAALGLSAEARAHAFDTIKLRETVGANLALTWGLHSLDGFDGGVLPTAHYTAFTALLLPPDTLRTIDGRLREILARPECRGACLPDRRWLDLTGTRYLITDKIFDLWHADIAYDTQIPAALIPGEAVTFADPVPFTATDVMVLYRCAEAETCAPPRLTDPPTESAAAPVTMLDGYTLAAFQIPPQSLGAVTLTAAEPVTIRAVTLADARVDAFRQLTPAPWHRVLSSDIKIYANGSVLPRALVVPAAQFVPDTALGTESALTLMRDPAFSPAQTVVIAG